MRQNTFEQTPTTTNDGLAVRSLERDLFDAVTDESFELRYRPLYDRRSGELAGVDAHLSWQHRQLGVVPPRTFWPIAEATGMVIPMGDWVLWQACLQLAAWTEDELRVQASISVSAQHLVATAFLATVADAIETSGIDPGQLCLVLTGTIDIDDCARVESLLAHCGPTASGSSTTPAIDESRPTPPGSSPATRSSPAGRHRTADVRVRPLRPIISTAATDRHGNRQRPHLFGRGGAVVTKIERAQ
ncbi:MAG: EAL domain-containing protein [Acidimicrobiales bacterium]